MNLEELINILDDMVLNGWSLPLSGGKCVVDREKVKDVIQDMRLNMPNEILQNARMEAEAIVEKARERAAALVEQEEITRVAKEKANLTVQTANAQVKEIKGQTRDYTERVMEAMEELLTKSLLDVKQTRQQIKNNLK